jgi:hypothetical protein
MASNIYSAGVSHVGSYQVSGTPYATGSIDCLTGGPKEIKFPFVTRWVVITNNDASNNLRVGFSANGVVGDNYFELGKADAADKTKVSPRLELKVTELHMSGATDVSIVAGLTNLPVQRVDNLSSDGTNWSGSAGVG